MHILANKQMKNSSSAHLDLFAFDTLPLNSCRTNNCKRSHDCCNQESMGEGIVISKRDAWKVCLAYGLLDGGCTGCFNVSLNSQRTLSQNLGGWRNEWRRSNRQQEGLTG